VTRKSTRKIKKSVFAIAAEAAAIPVKPKTAAIIATIKNIKDHLSMIVCFINPDKRKKRANIA
jgi:hypothetical protein